MNEQDDETIVARSRLDGLPDARKQELLNELFSRYHTRVAAWCYRVTGDRNAAADLAQDVLLRAYKNLDSWRGQSKFSTWLYTVTRNHCRNDLAAKMVRPEGASATLDFDVSDSVSRSADELLEAESEIREMKELMNTTLDTTEARVMTLHYGEEMTLDAVTRLLGLTNRSGAKAFIVSAKRKLAAVLGRKGGRK